MDITSFVNFGNETAPNALLDAAIEETYMLPSGLYAGAESPCQNEESATGRFVDY
jgi:hypothetical protein